MGPREQFARQRMRCTEMSGQSTAAAHAAAANAEAPGHVTQMSTVALSIDSVSTRTAPAKDQAKDQAGCCSAPDARAESRPSPRHPARHATTNEDGRSPGSRVMASCRLPDRSCAGRSVAQRQALTAYSCGGSRGFVPAVVAGSVPHSLFALISERPSTWRVHSRGRALSMVR